MLIVEPALLNQTTYNLSPAETAYGVERVKIFQELAVYEFADTLVRNVPDGSPVALIFCKPI
jgi:hypothetical protein